MTTILVLATLAAHCPVYPPPCKPVAALTIDQQTTVKFMANRPFGPGPTTSA